MIGINRNERSQSPKYATYLEKQPDGKRRSEIADKLEQHYFDSATDISGMLTYLEKQPDGKRRSEIVDKLEQYYFDRATDISSMLTYLEKQPDGKRRSEVTDKIEQYYFDRATDISGMLTYLEKQPDGKRRDEITDKIEQYYYEKAIGFAGIQAYLEKLPDGKRRNEVSSKLEQYFFNKATDISGMQTYLEKQPNGKRRNEITDKLEQLYFDNATDVAGMQAYLEKQPNGKRRNEVSNKLEQHYFDKTTDVAGMLDYIQKQPEGKRKAGVEQRLKNERAKIDKYAPDLMMVQIPSGSFVMGCSEDTDDCADDEYPRHEVKIPAFKLSKTEITFAQYDAFAKATKRELPKDEGWGRGNHPVINVSWHDALAYTKWLSEQMGEEFRLPSEAEWEYAARAVTTSKYSWGNAIDCSKASYDGGESSSCYEKTKNGNNRGTAAVGSYSTNSFGLQDMHGC